MLPKLCIIILMLIVKIKCDCNEFGIYSYLGVVNTFYNRTVSCQDDNESCVYIFFDIPDLSTGYIQSCYSKIRTIFNGIVNTRFDVQDSFYNSYCEETDTYEIDYYCENYNDKIYVNSSLSGLSKLYTYCFNDSMDMKTWDWSNYHKEVQNQVGVICGNDTMCSEGYCGLYKRSVNILVDGEYVRSIKEELSCINNIYNEIYKDFTNTNFNPVFRLDLLKAAYICNSKREGDSSITNNYSRYSWYIKCFNPNNEIDVDIDIEVEAEVETSPEPETTTSTIEILEESVTEALELTYNNLSSTSRNNFFFIFTLPFIITFFTH